MKDAAELTPDERALGYRNPARGDYRLRALAELQRQIAAQPSEAERRHPRRRAARLNAWLSACDCRTPPLDDPRVSLTRAADTRLGALLALLLLAVNILSVASAARLPAQGRSR